MRSTIWSATVMLALYCGPASAMNPQELLSDYRKALSPEEIEATKNNIHNFVKGYLEKGASASDGCFDALRRYGSYKLKYSQRECEEDMHQAESDAKGQRELQQAAAAQKRDNEILEMRAGTKKVASFEDAVAVHNAVDGYSLASAPKIRPDSKIYFLSGNIEQPDRTLPEFVAKANNGFANALKVALSGSTNEQPRYFSVHLSKEMEQRYYDLAKIGGGFDVVGKYVGNKDYKTVAGQTKSMPIFEAVYFDFWTSEKLK